MTDNNQTPPDWALIEAAKRAGWTGLTTAQELRPRYRDASKYTGGSCYRALCDMIAKHESPPPDRKLLCAREALSHTAFVYDPARDMIAEGERVCIRAIELWESDYGRD